MGIGINTHIGIGNIVGKGALLKLEPETIIQKNRIIADGGTIISLNYINDIIKLTKSQNNYTSAKLLIDANFAIKKDVNNKIIKLYDISSNNFDAVQLNPTMSPSYLIEDGKSKIVYDGINSFMECPFYANYGDIAVITKIKPASFNGYMSVVGGAANYAFQLSIENATGKPMLNRQFQDAIGIATTGVIANETSVIAAKYAQVAGNYSIYIDGILNKSGVQARALTSSTFRIGKPVTTEYFKGQINTTFVFSNNISSADLTAIYSKIITLNYIYDIEGNQLFDINGVPLLIKN